MKTRDYVSLAIGLALILSTALVLTGCGTPAQARGLHVTYYYHPGCGVCDKARPAVAALEREFPGQVQAAAVDATTPEGSRALRALDLDEHGLVIRSARGAVLWKQPDKDVNFDQVREE